MADTLDIVTYAEVVAGMSNFPVDRSDLLAAYITAVSRHIDARFGPVVQRTVTSETHHGNGCYVRLLLHPVVSVTSVSESGTALTASDYYLDAPAGLLERSRGVYTTSAWTPGRWNVVVTYVAGRYTTTATVDARWKQAAIMAIANLWQSEQAIRGTQTFGPYDDVAALPATFVLPRAAYMLIADEEQPKVGIA